MWAVTEHCTFLSLLMCICVYELFQEVLYWQEMSTGKSTTGSSLHNINLPTLSQNHADTQ